MQTFHTFKDTTSFEKYLRTKHEHCEVAGKYGGCLDYVTVNGTLYTMQEYDEVGRSITWGNVKKQKMLELITPFNRYHAHGYSNATVGEYPMTYSRNDIQYAQ